MISKRQARGVQHLLGMLQPDHPRRYQLVKGRAEEVVSELADLSAKALGDGLDGVQFLAGWEHQREIAVWLTVHEAPGPLALDGAHLDEEAARHQAESEVLDSYETGTVFSWAPAYPDGPQALFADPPEGEEHATGYQVRLVSARLG